MEEDAREKEAGSVQVTRSPDYLPWLEPSMIPSKFADVKSKTADPAALLKASSPVMLATNRRRLGLPITNTSSTFFAEMQPNKMLSFSDLYGYTRRRKATDSLTIARPVVATFNNLRG